METKFNNFLNEYGGPYKAAGFRYSEPKIEYTFSVIVLVNTELSIIKLNNDIKNILKDNRIEEDNFNFMKESGDQYELRINMTAYSNLEIIAACEVILKKLTELYPEDINVIIETMDVTGGDIDVKRNPIGFRK